MVAGRDAKRNYPDLAAYLVHATIVRTGSQGEIGGMTPLALNRLCGRRIIRG
jgi:hypothetical protein